MPNYRSTVKELFLRRLPKAIKTTNGCLLWPATNRQGYGELSVYLADGKRHKLRVHRVAWELANGPIPDGLYVCHHCDNPSCFCVEHLFIGSQSDNLRDCQNKGRSARGEKHGASKLTVEDVRHMRELRKTGLSFAKIAAQFSVQRSAVYKIIKRQHWRHVE